MAFKVYLKRGNTNYKEKKLVKKLTEFVEQEIAKDPTFKIEPAQTFEELQALHDKYCVQDVGYTEIKDNGEEVKVEASKKSDKTSSASGDDAEDTEETDATDSDATDPFNREEPIVRDYVLNNDPASTDTSGEGGDASQSGKTNFSEPVNFGESFDIPGSEPTRDDGKGSSKKQEPKKEPPLNPDFDSLSGSKKKKQAKRFAKNIINVGCVLLEHGYVWFVTKDIKEEKLVEYQIDGTIDPRLLAMFVEIEGEAQVTIRDFFRRECVKAEQIGKISQPQREEMTDALHEVFLEKGIAPTPMQDFMMCCAEAVAPLVLSAIQSKMNTNSILDQLRAMTKEQGYTPPKHEERKESTVSQEEVKQEKKSESNESNQQQEVKEETKAEVRPEYRLGDAEVSTKE